MSDEKPTLTGHQNPLWEAGYQHGLYVMPDSIAICAAKIRQKEVSGQEVSRDEYRRLLTIVIGIMKGDRDSD